MNGVNIYPTNLSLVYRAFVKNSRKKHKQPHQGRYLVVNGKRIELINLMYILKNSGIAVSDDDERDFITVYNHLRSSKYTPYSHCKYCFLEQQDYSRTNDSRNCHLCGLPLIKYLYMRDEERFCVTCSLMNRYHPRPHIRCLLHESASGKKKLGAMYVLYKEYFSISSASKSKKKTRKSERLKLFLKEEVWKLNSLIRFEFLYSIRNLVGIDLIDPSRIKDNLRILKSTREEIISRVSEIGSSMQFSAAVSHDLDYNFDEYSEKSINEFYQNLSSMLNLTREKIEDHIMFLDNGIELQQTIFEKDSIKYEDKEEDREESLRTKKVFATTSPRVPPKNVNILEYHHHNHHNQELNKFQSFKMGFLEKQGGFIENCRIQPMQIQNSYFINQFTLPNRNNTTTQYLRPIIRSPIIKPLKKKRLPKNDEINVNTNNLVLAPIKDSESLQLPSIQSLLNPIRNIINEANKNESNETKYVIKAITGTKRRREEETKKKKFSV